MAKSTAQHARIHPALIREAVALIAAGAKAKKPKKKAP
jgi:hypothetical protein